MQDVRSAVIAVAGMGSRLGLGLPKCMIEIQGKTILSRIVNTLRSKVEIINIVVGYREEMVIEYCSQHHRDVGIVRNPNYKTTNTAYSMALGSRHLSDKVIYLDGDLIISPTSVEKFIQSASKHNVLVGLTDAKSENAVFAHGYQDNKDIINLTKFSRTEGSSYEWANIVSGPANLMENAERYVFEHLEGLLPLPGAVLEVAEIDTPEDLISAKAFVSERLV